jgi:hypothetical protein
VQTVVNILTQHRVEKAHPVRSIAANAVRVARDNDAPDLQFRDANVLMIDFGLD